MRRVSVAVIAALLATATLAGQQPRQSFRATVDFVSTDVIVRKDGTFVPDLQAGEFRVYEDDVLQTITVFEPWIGGRSLGNVASAGTGARRG